tara:strand:- start:117 stop:485 length:369 start_codon:yes stop_codon:yes gene_type:complete
MDELTFDLLCNHQKIIKNKKNKKNKKNNDIIHSKINSQSPQKTINILLNNIEQVSNHLTHYNTDSLDILVTTMLETVKAILVYKKTNHDTLEPSIIKNIHKLVSIYNTEDITKENTKVIQLT